MTVFRRVLVAGGVVAGLAGAYFAGAVTNRPTVADSEATARSQAPESTADLNGMKMPDALPPATPAPVTVPNPGDVLTGAAPIPLFELRPSPPPPPPTFVVPDLSAPAK